MYIPPHYNLPYILHYWLRLFLSAADETGNDRVIDTNAGKTLRFIYQQDRIQQSSANGFKR